MLYVFMFVNIYNYYASILPTHQYIDQTLSIGRAGHMLLYADENKYKLSDTS